MNYEHFKLAPWPPPANQASYDSLASNPALLLRIMGAGSGCRVVRVSSIIGAGGRVIAEDNRPEDLRSLRRRVGDLGLQNVATSLGESHVPRLPSRFARCCNPGAHARRDCRRVRANVRERRAAQCPAM